MANPPISKLLREEIIRSRAAGETVNEVAAKLGVSRSTVEKYQPEPFIRNRDRRKPHRVYHGASEASRLLGRPAWFDDSKDLARRMISGR